MKITPLLVVLILVAVGAIVIAGLTVIAMLKRRDLLRRAAVDDGTTTVKIDTLMADKGAGGLAQVLGRFAPASVDNSAMRSKLLQAGIESSTAPQSYFVFRLVSFVAFPFLALLLAPRDIPAVYLFAVGLGLFAGFIAPVAMLDRMVRIRQEAITRSVPDALDLLVVCVEAGISLDAAILRVSRELRFLHPDISSELAAVSRLMNAGVSREKALRGLYERTGVGELRTIASSMVQSEKLGTSIATVLRVAAETLRRKRRQSAEKQAKQAPVKMIFPLMLFILPALFVVVLGPAIFVVIQELVKL
jgi:tight adherence protein C